MSKARSPRDVCSITIGIRGLIHSPRAGGPQFRIARGLLLLGCPELVACMRELRRDASDLSRDAVEGAPEAKVFPELLEASRALQGVDGFGGIVFRPVELLAHDRLDVVVRDLEGKLVGGRVEHELARYRPSGFAAEPLLQLLRRLLRHGEVGVDRDAAALERLEEPGQESAGSRVDELRRYLDLRGLDERIGDVRPELRVRLLLELRAQPGLDVLAQVGERLELAGRAGEVVIERRQDALLQLLQFRLGRLTLTVD